MTNKIFGEMLRPNLLRQGVDLTFDTDLLHLNTIQRRVGINTTSPGYPLTVVGAINTGQTLINTGSISTLTGNLTLTPAGSIVLSTLTANAVPFLNASNELQGTSALTFDGSNLVSSGSIATGDISLSGSAINANAALTIQSSGSITLTPTGDVFVSDLVITNSLTSSSFETTNLLISGDTIQATVLNSDVVITPHSGGSTVLSGTNGVVIPVGTYANRPGIPDTGIMRFNTDTLAVEVWDGGMWGTVGPNYAEISSQIIIGDDSSTQFTLDQTASTEGILVHIDGVAQVPTSAYTVTGNQITFTEPLLSTDTAEIRFLTTLVSIPSLFDGGSY